MRTLPGTGGQEIHSDVQLKEDSTVCYFIILYLHATVSTAVANVPTNSLDSVWAMTKRQAETRFRTVEFITEQVDTGDTLLMRGTTFHCAINNPDSFRRFVGFLSFTPRNRPPVNSQLQFDPLGVSLDGSDYYVDRSARQIMSVHSVHSFSPIAASNRMITFNQRNSRTVVNALRLCSMWWWRCPNGNHLLASDALSRRPHSPFHINS